MLLAWPFGCFYRRNERTKISNVRLLSQNQNSAFDSLKVITHSMKKVCFFHITTYCTILKSEVWVDGVEGKFGEPHVRREVNADWDVLIEITCSRKIVQSTKPNFYFTEHFVNFSNMS